MNLKAFAFRKLFGGKPWYESCMGWAVLVISVSEVAMPIIVEFGLLNPELTATLQIKLRALSGALGGIGIRRRLPANGTAAVALIACLLLPLGCNTFSVTTQVPDKPPVTVKAMTTGRGCIAAEVDPTTGKISIVTQQDGTSDWITGRIIPSITGLGIAILTGRAGEQISMMGPDDTAGCQGIFESDLDTDEKESLVYEIVPVIEGNDALIVR